MAGAQLFEDFESGTKGSYATGLVELDTGPWILEDALIGNDDRDKRKGSQSVRLRNGSVYMDFNTNGAGDVSFFHANAGFSGDTGGRLQLQYSQNDGKSWTDIGDEVVSPESDMEQATVDVHIDGNIRFRIVRTAGHRINIDNFTVTGYNEESKYPRLRAEVSGNVIRSGETIDFGYAILNESRKKYIELFNTGRNNLVISSVTVTGDGYSIQGMIPEEIEPDSSAIFPLLFEPAGAGIQTGSLMIEANDPDAPVFNVNLSGSGIDSEKPVDIADARNMPMGTMVSVSGWVTVTGHFSGPVFFQDETAGMASFYEPLMRDPVTGFSLDISEGDSIVVTGPLTHFNGLLQIAPADNYEKVHYRIYPESNRSIEPTVITLSELNTGNYESRLVKIENVRIPDQGRFTGDSDYTVTDASGDSEVRISRFTDLPGMNIPYDAIHITGVAGRFNPSTRIDLIQLLPRSRSDITGTGNSPVIVSDAPYEINATSSSITFHWITDREGTSEVRYGYSENFELGKTEDAGYQTRHQLKLENLEPATIYHVQLRSAFGEDTTRTPGFLVTTSSPEETTQQINVYFNRHVDHSLATFEKANFNYNFADQLIDRIENANHSLDLALYSIGGEIGNQIAGAVIDAYQRGVVVRVIVDHNTNTDQFEDLLVKNGIPVIESNFGETNQDREGIHHNKYAIIDYDGGNPDQIWLITSSWNATDPGTHEHYQNMIEFQDVAIAGAYTREFNQKWGSDSATPDATRSLFGSRKKVVNPSTFWIGDSYIRLFFSPQGNTETAIVESIRSARHTVNLGTMLITRNTITQTLFDRFTNGVTIRGVLGQPGQRNSQIELLSGFADIHTQTSPLLHHKYAIIDGEKSEWNGTVITGSHNWSASANQRNDENTVIITDSRIANLYIQEFSARYHQAGGSDEIITAESIPMDIPDRFRVDQNQPNPFNPETRIVFELPKQSHVTIRIFDTLGREVAVPVTNELLPAGPHTLNFNANMLAGGIYFYRIQLGDGRSLTRAMTLIK